MEVFTSRRTVAVRGISPSLYMEFPEECLELQAIEKKIFCEDGHNGVREF